MTSGATVTWRRVSTPASRNRETVVPPPSTRIRDRPCARKAATIAAGARRPSGDAGSAGSSSVSPAVGARARPAGGPPDDDRPRRAVAEDRAVAVQTAARVEDHPDRVRAFHRPHGEAGVVGRDGAGPHDDRVDERPQPVQAADVRGTGDVVRVPPLGRDAAVQALADLADDETGVELQRQIQVQELPRGGARRRRRPPGARVDVQRDRTAWIIMIGDGAGRRRRAAGRREQQSPGGGFGHARRHRSSRGAGGASFPRGAGARW